MGRLDVEELDRKLLPFPPDAANHLSRVVKPKQLAKNDETITKHQSGSTSSHDIGWSAWCPISLSWSSCLFAHSRLPHDTRWITAIPLSFC
jgi:hypothetical protein